jgi:hypothetical protein
MSATYLDRFRSALPAIQGRQLLKILTAKRDSGEIRTLDEFKQKLQDLTSELLSDRLKPTLKLFEAVGGEDISSEQYNFMLERIEDDLEAIFTEADNLDEIIAAHHNLISRVALKSLRLGVNQLESRISLYEFIQRNQRGIDDALNSTFRESESISLSRKDQVASLLYVDPRTLESISTDSSIDPVGERLVLGADNIDYASIREARWSSGSNSIKSELDVSFPNSDINNIIDGQDNTYWLVPILLSSPKRGGVPLELYLDLGMSRDVNFLEIEPASPYPMRLVSVEYLDNNGVRQSTQIEEAQISGPGRINFSRVSTQHIILRFSQEHYKEIQFRKKRGESNFHKAVLGESSQSIDIESISDDLQDVLSSDFVINDVLAVPSDTQQQKKFFEYILGFDNVRTGLSNYSSLSSFVSKPKTVSDLGLVALRTVESRPVQPLGVSSLAVESYSYPARSGTEDAKFYHASTEHWAGIQSFDTRGALVSTDIVPILPLGASRVYHERLVLTHKTDTGFTSNNAGKLIFFTEADSEDVKVYKDSVELIFSTDWDFVSSGDSTALTNTVPGGGTRMSRGIKIISEPSSLDIFTVSYTPKTSSTRILPSNTEVLDVVDMTGDQSIRMLNENELAIDGVRKSFELSSAKVYLVTIMRRNSAHLYSTPALEEFMLMTGSRGAGKFISDA